MLNAMPSISAAEAKRMSSRDDCLIREMRFIDSSGHDNILTVYMIFNTDFNGMITAKAFDKKGAEMGRVKVPVDKKKEEAGFVEFRFDPRTNIDTDSKIILE